MSEVDIDRYLSEAFSRNLGLISPGEQLELAKARVAIPGLGGVGGLHLVTLTRLGIGNFSIADFDVFEPPNVNRQYGARFRTIGKKKLDVMLDEALAINPRLDIRKFPEGVSPENIDQFLEGVDVVVDSVDFFAFEMRRLIFNEARKRGIYVVSAGPIGFSCALLIFSPHTGLSFDEYFDIREGMSDEEKTIHFQLGLAPRTSYLKYGDPTYISHTEKRGPSLGLACQLCSGAAAAEVVRIVLKRNAARAVPHYFQFDPYLRKYYKGYIWRGNKNPIQKIKIAVAKRLLNRAAKLQARSKPIEPASVIGDEKAAITAMIEAGIQAPSGDNLQPWQFAARQDRIEIICRDHAKACFYDYQGWSSLISCGAALENIRIAAHRFGFNTEIEMPQPFDINIAGTIHLKPGTPQHETLYDVIWWRHTNRKPYQNRPLLQESEEIIRRSIAEFPTIGLHLLTSKADIAKIAAVCRYSDQIRLEMRETHDLLHQSVRMNEREVEETRDGMPLKSLEIGLPGEIFFRLTKSWSVISLLNRFGCSRAGAYVACRGMHYASAVGLLTVRGKSRSDFIEAGRAFQRLWLTAAKLGLAFQPMTTTVFFHLRWREEGTKNFYPQHIPLLERHLQRCFEIFKDVDFKNESDTILFRIGHATPAKVRSLRRSIDSFLIS